MFGIGVLFHACEVGAGDGNRTRVISLEVLLMSGIIRA
jgi:hypothetical protein